MEHISVTAQRLRARGCWNEAASVLALAAEADSSAALLRAAILVEQAMFTFRGWQEAETAVTHAELMAADDEQAGAAASERVFFAYAATLLNGKDDAETARSALQRADSVLSKDSPFRPLLEFRRGLIFENLINDNKSARSSYELAHEGATVIRDELLLSYTWRHLGSLAQQEGDLETARRSYAESLRLRENVGFVIGVAPALVTLASVSSEPEAAQMLNEARRLVKSLGGVPIWLADV